MAYLKEVWITEILRHLYLGGRFIPTMKIIRQQYPMSENTFLKYWKISKLRHWQNCNDFEKRFQEKTLKELLEYKRRYGNL